MKKTKMKKITSLTLMFLFLIPSLVMAQDLEADVKEFTDTLTGLIQLFAGGIALIVIMGGGVYYMTLNDDERQNDKTQKIKSVIMKVAIGLFIIAAAPSVVLFFTDGFFN